MKYCFNPHFLCPEVIM